VARFNQATGKKPSNHSRSHACCLLGCPMCAPIAAASPVTANLNAHGPTRVAAPMIGVKGPVLSPRRNQRQPRAPPQPT